MIHHTLLLALGTALAALMLVLAGWAAGRRHARVRDRRDGSIEVKITALAAIGCTAYSADTSWNFAGDYLDMASTAERAALFAVAELALVSTALMARRNLAVQGTPGLPGTLIWLITAVQVVPAYAESGLVGGSVRAFVGPIMAAVLWHLAMGIELRIRTGVASHGLLATLSRDARERLLSRLGVANRDRDAAQITRDRATTRAVALATHLSECSPQQRRSRRGRRTVRALSKAIGRAEVGTNPVQRAALLKQLAARRHALALATVPLLSPWSPNCDEESGDRGPGTGSRGRAVETDTDSASSCGTVPAPDDSEARPQAAGPRAAKKAPSSAGHAEQNSESPGQGTEVARGPSHWGRGTKHHGDRDHTVPLRRKPTPRTKAGTNGDRGRSRPPRHRELSIDDLVDQVRPHVPALLARDGNESITRVQLREILRRDGLGCRNDKLTVVLKQLRNDDQRTRSLR